jgi:hypothetical protein
LNGAAHLLRKDFPVLATKVLGAAAMLRSLSERPVSDEVEAMCADLQTLHDEFYRTAGYESTTFDEAIAMLRSLSVDAAIQAEGESILLQAGPITCRDGKQHERWEGCLYCLVDDLRGTIYQSRILIAELQRVQPQAEPATICEECCEPVTLELVEVLRCPACGDLSGIVAAPVAQPQDANRS